MVQADAIPVGRAVALRLAQADRAVVPVQVPDRLAALTLDLADAMPAERPEQLAVERQASLDRGDDEIDVVDPHRIQARFDATHVQSCLPCRPVHLFHYHLVTSRVREVEARYI